MLMYLLHSKSLVTFLMQKLPQSAENIFIQVETLHLRMSFLDCSEEEIQKSSLCSRRKDSFSIFVP